MKKIYSFLLVLFVAFILVGCGEKVTLTLNEEDKQVTLEEGQEKTVTPVVTGEAVLVWTSSDPEVATVSEGKITAKKFGTATITVSVQDKEISATIALTVTKKYEISISDTQVSLQQGETKTVTPTYTDGATLVWTTSNAAVATVENGTITAVGIGEAKITATVQEKETVKAEISVVVTKKLADSVTVTLSKSNVYVGETVEVSAVVAPEYADQEVEWTLSDSNLATLENGVITTTGAGRLVVKATAKDGSEVFGEATLKIYENVSGIKIEGPTRLEVGQESVLLATATNENTNDEFTFASSDETVATVDELGTVVALKAGTAIITVTATDSGAFSKTVEIEVKEFKLAIGETEYTTLAEALAAAQEGDTITLAPGEYAEALTISINNLTIKGPNAGIEPDDPYKFTAANLTAKITVAEGVSGFTVDGCALSAGAYIALEKNTSNIALQYCALATTNDGVIRGPAAVTGEEIVVSNIKMNYNYSEEFSSYRFLHITDTIDGLEMIGNKLIGSSTYDFINVGKKIKGTVVIKNNTYTNSLQSFLYVKGVGVLDCTIEGNYTEGIANTVIDFRNMLEDGAVVFNIKNNEFVNSGTNWMPIRVRTAGYDANDTITVNVVDNKFIDSYCEGDVPSFIENPSYVDGTGAFEKNYTIGKNYYEIDGVAVTELTDAHFNGAAISFEAGYASKDEIGATQE